MEGRYPTNEIVNGGIATIDVPGSAPANHITRHVGLHGIVIDKGAPAQRIAFCPHVVIRMFVPRGGGWRRQHNKGNPKVTARSSYMHHEMSSRNIALSLFAYLTLAAL